MTVLNEHSACRTDLVKRAAIGVDHFRCEQMGPEQDASFLHWNYSRRDGHRQPVPWHITATGCGIRGLHALDAQDTHRWT